MAGVQGNRHHLAPLDIRFRGYNGTVPFDPHFIARLIPALLEGAVVTVELAALTVAICLVWGLLVALAHGMHGPLGLIAGGYIQLVRNTPLLIQLYLVYFGFSMAGYGLSGFASGLLALCARMAAMSPKSIAAGCNRSAPANSKPGAPSACVAGLSTRQSFCHRS
jgi:His/Glu/Gln/Arg/opine family amino acid ABC transporter permease subunit